MSKNNTFKTLYRLKIKKNDKEGGKRILKKTQKEPLLTIITVVLNQEKYLDQTIRSVLRQKCKDFEYIIIDGGSKDKTIKIIKKYSNKLSYWISQKDKGIYHAFNKGMILARGKYIGIIN